MQESFSTFRICIIPMNFEIIKTKFIDVRHWSLCHQKYRYLGYYVSYNITFYHVVMFTDTPRRQLDKLSFIR